MANYSRRETPQARGPTGIATHRTTPRGYGVGGPSLSGSRGTEGNDNGYPRSRPPPRPPAGYASRAPRSEPRSPAPPMRPRRIRGEESADSHYEDTRRPSGRPRAEISESSSTRRPTRPVRHAEPQYDHPDGDDQASARAAEAESQEASSSWGWDSWKKTVWGEEKQNAPAPNEADSTGAASEVQAENQPATFWTRIATVGATLIFGGDDGYASDATDYEGDSHLIRIMKEYYVEKAQSEQDLPPWLFSVNEIGPEELAAKGRSGVASRAAETPNEYPRGFETRNPSSPSQFYEYAPGHRRSQRGYPNSPRNNNSFDSGYASGPSPKPNGRNYEREDENYQPSQKTGRISKNPGSRGRDYNDDAPRDRRGRQDDYDGMYDEGPAYSASRNYNGVGAEHEGRRRDPYKSRGGQVARARPYEEEPPFRQASSRDYPTRAYREF